MLWDLDLCLFYKNVPAIPFHCLVSLKPPSSSVLESFHRFTDLPADIHLLIFQFCDVPTLFQLMHTCSDIRHECLKLFWTQNNSIWYRCQDDLFEQYMSNRIGLVSHCPEFASHVTQVEIYLSRMEWIFRYNGRFAEERARCFWEMVQEFFPSARKVVLAGMTPRKPFPPPDGEYEEDYSRISSVVELAPPHLTPFVAFDEPWRLWRVGTGTSWRVVEECWVPKRAILPPQKKLPNGLLGEYMSMVRKRKRAHLEASGLKWLRIETYSRYSEEPGIACLDPECDAMFADKSEWSQHIRANHEGLLSTFGNIIDGRAWYRHTPVEVKAVLNARQDRIEALLADYRVLSLKLNKELGEYGTDELRESLSAQMKEEKILAPGESLVQSPLWDEG